MFNQTSAYIPFMAQVKISLAPEPVCQQCGGPAQIADPFSQGDYFPCDCTMDRTPVLAPLEPGPISWMEPYLKAEGEW